MNVIVARRVVMALAAVLALAGVTACTGGATPGTTPDMIEPSGAIVVIAGGPLIDVLNTLGGNYQKAHPTVRVTVRPIVTASNVNSADVLANETAAVTMAGDGLAGVPAPLAHAHLVIAVAAGNPKQIVSLADLTRPNVTVALCDENQSCGAAASQVLGASLVQLTPPIKAPDAKAAIAEVAAGRADAALVYRSDARAAEKAVATVEFPESRQAVADYQIATLRASTSPAAAAGFLAYATSPAGADVLAAAGFQPP